MRPVHIKKDPPVRKDKRCARYPECKKPLPPPTRYASYVSDPFCSTGCCQLYHGVER